jgi:zinc transporter ZupT
MEQRPQTNRPRRRLPNGAGLAIGIAIGVALGVALHNIGLGIAIGVALGVVFESTNARRNRQ